MMIFKAFLAAGALAGATAEDVRQPVGVTETPLSAATPVSVATTNDRPGVCRRLPFVQPIAGTKVDVGRCSGMCRNVANPWLPRDVARPPKNHRVCKPKVKATQYVSYTKIERCGCIEKSRDEYHELQTDEDIDNEIKWNIRDDAFDIDQKIKIPIDWRRCRRFPKTETLGTDANGSPITVDVGECRGMCPVVVQPPKLTVNVTLTGDDLIQAVYIDGVDRTPSMVNEAAWTRQDTVLYTVPRAPGTEHVVAVKVRDTARSMQGFLAAVAYDGAVQHLTGDSDWVASSTNPASIGGLQWFEQGYDAVAGGFATPTECTVADHSVWGTYWPAALRAEGARWIWGPDSQCRVSNAPSTQGWFLLKFTIDKIPEQSCHPTAQTSQRVAVEVVKSCDCQCQFQQECKAPQVWNDQSCQCECGLDASACPVGTIFNAEKCTCENCGICDARTEEECRAQQCLFTFYPFSPYQGRPGNCVWRDFNQDGVSECGCPQNQCQTQRASGSPNRCKDTICRLSTTADGSDTKEMCDYNDNATPGSECDCAANQA